MQASASADMRLPSLATDQTVTLQSHDGKGLGFDVGGNARDGFVVQDVQASGAAGASGKIKAGDRISGISLGLENLGVDDVRKILKILAPYPVKLQVKGSGSGGMGVDLSGPNISGPNIGFDGKGPQMGFTGPSVGIGGHHGAGLTGPNLDINANANAQGNLSPPSVEGDIKVKGQKGDRGSWFEKHMPKIGFGKSGKYSVSDAEVGKAEVEIKDITPKADIQMPGFEFGGSGGGNMSGKVPKAGITGGGFGLDSKGQKIGIDVPQVSGDASIGIGGPRFDTSGSMPQGNIDASIDAEMPDPRFDAVEKPKGGFHLPKFGVHATGPKTDLPKGDVNIHGNIGGPKLDVNMPHGNVDIDSRIGADGNIGVPHGSSGASLNIDGPHIDMSKPDIHMDAQKPKGNFGVEMPSLSFGGKGRGPKGGIDGNLPHAGADASLSLEGPHAGDVDFGVNAPTIHGKGIEGGIGFTGPSADFDAKFPRGKIGYDGEIEGPSLNIDAPSIDIKGEKRGFDLGGKVKGLFSGGAKKDGNLDGDIGFKGELPHGEVDISGPRGSINMPHGDADASLNLSGPHMHGPNIGGGFGIGGKGMKIEGPDVGGSVNVGGPSIDVGSKFPKGDIGVSGDPSYGLPHGGVDVDVNAPSIDVKGSKGLDLGGKMKGLFGGHKDGKIKGGIDADVDLPNVDVELPQGGLDAGINAEIPDARFDANGKGKGGFHLPKFGGHVKGPKVDIPKGEVDINTPHIGGSINTDIDVNKPDIHLDAKRPKGGFGIGVPSLGFGGKSPKGGVEVNLPHGSGDASIGTPHVGDIGFDANAPTIKGPGIGGGVGYSGPSADFNAKLPKGNIGYEGEIEGPSLDIEGPSMDIKGEKKGFDLGGKMKGLFSGGAKKDGNLEGDIGLKGEFPHGGVDISGPRGSINVPHGDADGSLNLSGPHIHGPNIGRGFGIGGKGMKIEGPDIGGNINVGGPSIDVESKYPTENLGVSGDVGYGLPHGGVDVDVNAPSIDVKGSKGLDLGGKMKGLFGGHKEGKIKGGVDADINMPSVDVQLPQGGFDADIGAEVPDARFDADGKGKGGFHLPKFGGHVKGPKVDLPKGEFDVNSPHAEGSLDTDIDVDGKGKGGFHLPKFGGHVKGPKVDIPQGDLDITAPHFEGSLNTDIDANKPDIHLDAKKPKAGFSVGMPSLGFGAKTPKGGPDISLPQGSVDASIGKPHGDIDFDANTPTIKGSGIGGGIGFTGPSADFEAKLPKGKIGYEGDIDGPSLDIEGPSMDIKGERKGFDLGGKVKGLFSGGAKKEGKFDGDIGLKGELPQFDVDISGPKENINMPHGDADASLNLAGPHIHGPNVGGGFGIGGKGMKIEGPDVGGNINVGGPSIDVGSNYPKGNLGMSGDAAYGLPHGGVDVDVNAPSIDVKGPKGQGFGGKMKGLFGGHKEGKIKGGVDADIDLPSVGVELPEGDFDGSIGGEIPDARFDADGKGKGGFHLPKFGGNVKGPKADLPKGDFDVNAPRIEGSLDTDIDVDGKGKGGFHLPKFGGHVKGPKVDIPKGDLDINAPHIEGSINTDIDVNKPDIHLDAKKPKAGFSIGMPSLGFGAKSPKGGADVSLPQGSVDASIGKPHGEIGFDANAPTIKGPGIGGGIGFTGPSVDLDAKLPKGKIGHEGEIEGPSLDIEGPSMDIKGERKGFDLGGKVKGLFSGGAKKEGKFDGDIGLKEQLPQLDVDISGPKGNINMPHGDADASVNLAGPHIHGPNAGGSFGIGGKGMKIEGPDSGGSINVEGPSIDVGSKYPKGDLGVSGDGGYELPHGGVDVDVNAPSIDVKGSKGLGFGGKMKGLFGGHKDGKIKSGVDADIDLPNVDVELPEGGFDANIGGEIPDARFDADGKARGGFHLPKFGGHVKGPKVDLPKGDIDVNAPHVEGSLDTDIDVDGKGKGGFHLPKFGGHVKGPKVDIPKGELDINAPHIEGSLNTDIDINKPDIHLDAKKPKAGFSIGMPSLGFGAKSPKGGADVNLPQGSVDASIGKPHGEIGFDANAPTIKGPGIGGGVGLTGPSADFDAKLPKGKIGYEGEIEGPSLDIEGPSMDIKGEKRGFDLGGKVKGLFSGGAKKEGKFDGGIGLKGELPQADVDISGPKGNINLPHGDADASLNLAGPHIHGPNVGGGFKIGGNGMKIEGPDVDTNINVGGPSIDVGSKFPKGDLGLSGDAAYGLPHGGVDVDVNAPSIDVKGSKGLGFGGKMKGLFGGHKEGKVKGGVDADIDLPSVDVELPEGGLDANIGGEIPDARFDADGKAKGGFHLPKFGGHVKGPKVDLPKGDFDVNAPHVEGSLDTDIDVDGKGKGGFHLPKFGGHVKGPQVDIPKGDLDINAPHIEGSINTDIDVNKPDIHLDAKKSKGGFSIGMPSLGFGAKSPKGGADVSLPQGSVDASIGKPHVGDIGFDANAPTIKGSAMGGSAGFAGPSADFDAKLPKEKIGYEGEIEGPSLDIEGPSLDIKGGKKGFDLGGKVKGLFSGSSKKDGKFDGDIGLKGELPQVDVDVSGPKGNINMPHGDADASVNLAGPHIHGPNVGGGFGIGGKGMKFEGPDVGGNINVGGPSIDVGSKFPKGDLGVSGGADLGLPHGGIDVDVNAPSVDVKGKKGLGFGGKMKGLFGGSGKKDARAKGSIDADIELPDVNIELPEAKGSLNTNTDVEIPDTRFDAGGKAKGGISLPKFGAHAKGPKVDLPEGNVSINSKAPSISVDVPQVKAGTYSKFSSNEGLPHGGASADIAGHADIGVPSADINVDSKKSKGGFVIGLPHVNIGGKKPEIAKKPEIGGEISAPRGSVDASLNIEGQSNIDANVDAKRPKSGIHVEMPKFGFGSKTPKADVSGNVPHISASSPSADMNVRAPDISLRADAPEAKIDAGKSKGGFYVDLPTIGAKGTKGEAPKPPGFGGEGSTGGHMSMNVAGPQLKTSGGIEGSSNVGFSGDVQAPTMEYDDRAMLSDKKEGGLGKKMKGLFSTKEKKPSSKGSISAGGSTDASVGLKTPELHLHGDVERPQVEGGFATSYDTKLEGDSGISIKNPAYGVSGGHERAVDVGPAGDASASVRATGQATPPEAKGSKGFGISVKLGKGSSKDKKGKPNVEGALKSSLDTAGVAGGIDSGDLTVQTSTESQKRSKDDKRKGANV